MNHIIWLPLSILSFPLWNFYRLFSFLILYSMYSFLLFAFVYSFCFLDNSFQLPNFLAGYVQPASSPCYQVLNQVITFCIIISKTSIRIVIFLFTVVGSLRFLVFSPHVYNFLFYLFYSSLRINPFDNIYWKCAILKSLLLTLGL